MSAVYLVKPSFVVNIVDYISFDRGRNESTLRADGKRSTIRLPSFLNLCSLL